MDIQQRLDRFFEEIQKEDFLNMRGLGNEVPYFIFDYNPEHELIVRQSIRYFVNRAPLRIQVLNLLEMVIELFADIGLEGLKQYEEEYGTEGLFDALRPVIEEQKIVDNIADAAKEAQIVFITGIGSVFPLIRANELLNQLHPKVTDVPVVLFYPGTYTGLGLSLFNRFESNGYYRAFSI